MQDTNRVAVAGISPGLSVSETPGLGVAGDIIHFYRVAVAAKRPTGMRQNDQRGCGKTTNGDAAKQPMVCGETTDGGAANDQRMCGKRPTGLRQNNQRGRGKTTNGGVAKQPTGLWRNDQRGRGKTNDGGAIRMVFIDADVLPQPLRGNINKLTRYPASPGFRWRSTPGYIPQPLRG